MKFLLDANISHETANFLRQFNFDVKSLIEANLSHLTDAEVVELAKKEKRIIITFDLDFAEIFYFLEQKHFGVIILRLKDQRVESVNQVLGSFIKYCKLSKNSNKFNKSLLILNETGVRILE